MELVSGLSVWSSTGQALFMCLETEWFLQDVFELVVVEVTSLMLDYGDQQQWRAIL